MDAQEWDRRYTDTPWIWSGEPNVWVVRELSELPAGRALDLGAGEGRNAVWLARRGWQVDAVDFSAVALKRAEDLARIHEVALRTHVADMTRFAPEPEAYDLVLLAYLHLEPGAMDGVLRTAVGAARSGGTLLLIGHDVSNLTQGVGGPQDPRVLTSVDKVTSAWQDTADIVSAGVVRREVATESGKAWALDTLVRAVRR
jgi:SAM-dependent methyltransferase